MPKLRLLVPSLATAAVLLAPARSDAFCGFYVGGADARLTNNATNVVLMRDGTRTVLSMQNNYQGPPRDFAMVVPVPVILQEKDVKTLNRAVFDRIDQLAAPRLVEYWEQDPCMPPYVEEMARGIGGVPEMMAPMTDGAVPKDHGVTIEAQFTVGEYDIVILSAKEATGLAAWLRENKYSIPAGAEEVLRPYIMPADHCTKVYVVGGYVRDRLLARESKDLDVVCVGDGIALAEKLASKLRPYPHIAVYKRFGTAMIRHQDLEIEFVGARKESYQSDSRKPAVENGTLEDDQNRRDFTINAMAVSLNEDDYGQIIDPVNGFYDLEKKILRTPLDPDKTFTDDPLRMMRAIRFSTQLDFTIDPITLKSISKNKHRISIISKERISTELEKIILSPKPSVGFKLLFDTGLLHLIF